MTLDERKVLSRASRWPGDKRQREPLGPKIPWSRKARQRLDLEAAEAAAKRRRMDTITPQAIENPVASRIAEVIEGTGDMTVTDFGLDQAYNDGSTPIASPPSPAEAKCRLRLTLQDQSKDESDIEFVRPSRTRLTVKTPEVETYYAREFTEFTAMRRRQRREVAETIQPKDAGGHLLFCDGQPYVVLALWAVQR